LSRTYRLVTRVLALFLSLAALTAGPPPGVLAASTTLPPIAVYLDGLTVTFDVPPALLGGRALVPFRTLAEALGCTVDWDPATGLVSAAGPGTSPRTVSLWVDRTDAVVNGEGRVMDVPAQITEGRTLVPLRFFGEALGAQVTWDAATRTITVVSPSRPMRVLGYYALGTVETSSWTELFGRPFPDVGTPPADGGATDVVSEIACAWFVLDPATGGIVLDDSYSSQKRPDNWADVLARCGESDVAADMMVHWSRLVDGVADPAVYDFLASPDLMRRAVREIVDYAAAYRGVNLDLELLGQRQTGDQLATTRQRFTAFVQSLAEALRDSERTLTLSLHPLNSWYPGYEWEALGRLADTVVIMAYGYAPKGQPEPIGKVTEAVDLALAVVPKDKLLLGLLAQYETPESSAVKLGLAKRRGLAGIALWRLGVVGPARLTVIRSAIIRWSP
jgi:hypothetical protein